MSDSWSKAWYRDDSPSGNRGKAGYGPDAVTQKSGWSPPPRGGQPAGRDAWPAQPPTASQRRQSRTYTAREDPYDPYDPYDPWEPPSYGGGRNRRLRGQPGRRGRRIALILLTLVVVVIVAVVGTYFWVNGKLNRSVTLPAASATSAGQNWLIVGSDSRDGLTQQQDDALHVGDVGANASDSLMLLHTGGPKPVLISIPRDSYVPIPGHGENKINAALSFGGPSLLVQTVESVTGLNINHYMGIGFEGLVSVVNKVGGVRICLPTALKDTNSGVNLKAGCQNLNGTQALAFVRDRDSFASEDLQRIQDQRAFLKALLSKATSPGVFLNPFTALPFASTAASSIAADKGASLYDLSQAALALRGAQTGTVPIANANYETANAGDAVLWNRTQALALFDALGKDQAVPSGLLSGTKVG